MASESKQLALAVVGLGGLPLLAAWNANAPSLAECRDAAPGDAAIQRKLIDADILVGGTAVVLGSAVLFMTGEKVPLVLMLTMVGAVATWHHLTLNGAQSEDNSNGY